MFKKTLLALLLFSILLVSSKAEETEGMYEMEELSPIIQCDEQHNDCAEKCGDPTTPNACIEQCQLTADQCYNDVLSDTDDESESTESDVE